ncbi:MAG: hypothetical protein PHD51_02125 [Patescibacteria group bacterium]|nr:hypothetical protein [Patescibacteria group bacterium]MDD5490342.1 hypothetical protein [Patescibacteria group bacterium]
MDELEFKKILESMQKEQRERFEKIESALTARNKRFERIEAVLDAQNVKLREVELRLSEHDFVFELGGGAANLKIPVRKKMILHRTIDDTEIVQDYDA